MLNCLAAAILGAPIARPGRCFELGFAHPDWMAMQTRRSTWGTGEVTLRHLVSEALRMRPTRIMGKGMESFETTACPGSNGRTSGPRVLDRFLP